MAESRQAKNKRLQGYNPKPTPQTCCNCVFFIKDMVEKRYGQGEPFLEEKNLRCSLGGFAVKRRGTCNEFEFPF
jgi:hypothetical protein